MNKKSPLKYIPNSLSLLRMVLVLPFTATIHDVFVYQCLKNWILLLTFTIIILSDIADGFLARKLQCTTTTGAKLDVLSDTVYTMLSLATFTYFNIIPLWFIFLMVLKFLEFMVTSAIIKNRKKSAKILFFDATGKIAVSITMALPGIFVFRCIITDYKIVMNIVVYIITALLAMSFFNRMIYVLKTTK